MTTDKSSHLAQSLDLDRFDLAAVKAAPDPGRAFVRQVARQPRPKFRFEYDRKTEILDFLRRNYAAWRNFDLTEAQRLTGLTIEQARSVRALTTVRVLGQAWWATGDPKWGQAFERFYLAGPTGEMFNWGEFSGTQGSLELDAFFLLLDCDGFSEDGRIAFLDHLHGVTDAAWDTHTSRWSQLMLGPEGHNWYMYGIHTLPLLGLLFPEFKRSAFFFRTGLSLIEEHLRGHYRSDGGARETTLGYQCEGLAEKVWDMYVVTQRNGQSLSPQLTNRLMDATRFILRLATPAGSVPSFGDSRPVPGSVTTLAAVAAAATGDGELKGYAEQFRRQAPGAAGEAPGEIPLEAFWFVGLAGAATYAATRARNPQSTSVLMGQTGYAALRNSTESQAEYLAIAAADRGPIVTSHGHNDVFAVEVHAQGIRFLGEMGHAQYGPSPARDYDEKTEAHNCLAIDGMEQAPMANEWRWQGHVIPAVRRWISDDSHDFFHGVHEGYYRAPDHQTLHARKVLFLKSAPAYWIVFDWVESNVENPLTAYFHSCCPGRIDGHNIRLGISTGPQLAICPPVGDPVTPERISNPGLTAYLAEKKLKADDYPCFGYRRRVASECLAWVLAPLQPGEPAPRVRRLPLRLNGAVVPNVRATALEICFQGQTDRVSLSHTEFDAELQFGDESAWGFLAFRRTTATGSAGLSFTHRVSEGACGR